MHSERALQALLTIKDNIVLARTWAGSMSFLSFAEERQTFYAVTRCLEIISEASRRLPDALLERHPSMPWRDIADAGNAYRHAYDGVQERIVLATVQGSLPELERVVDEELAR